MCSLILNIINWSNQEPLVDFADYLQTNEKPLVFKINKAGVDVSSIWKDLVNPKPVDAARLHLVIDVLIEAVDDENLHPRIVSGVVRALGNNEIVNQRDLYDFLWSRYIRIPPSIQLKNPQARGLDQSFADSLSAHFKIYKFDKHRDLILNDGLGESRLLLLFGLSSHINDSGVVDLLEKLTDDTLFSKEAKSLLRKTKRGRGI